MEKSLNELNEFIDRYDFECCFGISQDEWTRLKSIRDRLKGECSKCEHFLSLGQETERENVLNDYVIHKL